MTLSGILSSPSQKRSFILASSLALGISFLISLIIIYFSPNTPLWNATTNFFMSIVSSGAFALLAGLYMSYFFVDPHDEASKIILLPEDIAQALQDIAKNATQYRIFVRTGRHFRAEILPVLIQRAIEKRLTIRLEVILLDFRDQESCKRYAEYRKSSSFDSKLWSTHYVQKEIFATILSLKKALDEHRSLLDINLYLSRRLSVFRVEGSPDAIVVTREDPKDTASRYGRNHQEYAAFNTEFSWIRDEADHIVSGGKEMIFPDFSDESDGEFNIATLKSDALEAMGNRSPYVR